MGYIADHGSKMNLIQLGRTFQDRTHIMDFTNGLGVSAELSKDMQNVNVRGKRGNIVQVYPSVEYDFWPNNIKVQEGRYINFCWSGSNTNPNNNDGQGKRGLFCSLF